MTDYLIIHKVRGQPAFDIACRCDDMGTPSDPGPWWIIPTSGHRAYPFKHWALEDLRDISDYPHANPSSVKIQDDILAEWWPDHYQVTEPNATPVGDLLATGRALLETIGLLKPKAPIRRRV
jgi:hypothetical protein